MNMFEQLSEQSAKLAEQQRSALKQSESFVFSKILNKNVKITEKTFFYAPGVIKETHQGNVTDVYEDYIELDNNRLISTKFISSIEIL